jgi:Trypsin-like peptidase domain
MMLRPGDPIAVLRRKPLRPHSLAGLRPLPFYGSVGCFVRYGSTIHLLTAAHVVKHAVGGVVYAALPGGSRAAIGVVTTASPYLDAALIALHEAVRWNNNVGPGFSIRSIGVISDALQPLKRGQATNLTRLQRFYEPRLEYVWPWRTRRTRAVRALELLRQAAARASGHEVMVASFGDCIGPPPEDGDSGSVLVNDDGTLVGLLVSGGGGYALAVDIAAIQRHFGFTLP